MSEFILLGTLFGAACGALHAVAVYRGRLRDGGGAAGPARRAALWTVALWTLFGAYLLAFWALGAVLSTAAALLGRRQAAA